VRSTFEKEGFGEFIEMMELYRDSVLVKRKNDGVNIDCRMIKRKRIGEFNSVEFNTTIDFSLE